MNVSMEWVEHIPALAKIFLALAVVLVALKLKIILSISLLIGAVFLGISFRMPPRALINAMVDGTLTLDTISVVVIVAGILILSNGMDVSGRLKRIVESFKQMVGESRITLVTFPALIGLLPMPGGAVFSAPMVGAVSHNSTLVPQHKTIINYWFRHIWEYWFPLYPGVILAISLTRVQPWKFIALNLPMTFVSLAAGYIVTLRHVSLGDKKHRKYSKKNILRFLNELIPIILMVSTLIFLGVIISVIQKTAGFESKLLERSPILVGLILSFSWVVIADKLTWRQVKTILLKKAVWQISLLVIAIMIFRSVLEQSNGVEILKEELLTYRIPLVGLIIVLPFVAGVVTGIAIGFVGASFPVVIALISSVEAPGMSGYAPIFLAYISGYLGMMLSPVHLCLLLTKDYFEANLMKVYREYLIPLAILSFIPAIILYIIYLTLSL